MQNKQKRHSAKKQYKVAFFNVEIIVLFAKNLALVKGKEADLYSAYCQYLDH